MSYRDGYIIKDPNDIGGRSTDVAQIGCSIQYAVKVHFPPNQVPTRYLDAIENLQKLLDVAELEIARVVEMLREDGA